MTQQMFRVAAVRFHVTTQMFSPLINRAVHDRLLHIADTVYIYNVVHLVLNLHYNNSATHPVYKRSTVRTLHPAVENNMPLYFRL